MMEALTLGVHTATVEGSQALIVVTRLLDAPAIKEGVSKKTNRPWKIETFNESIYNAEVVVNGEPLQLTCQLQRFANRAPVTVTEHDA